VQSKITARGSIKQQVEPATEGGAVEPEQGRVKIIIQPHKKTQ